MYSGSWFLLGASIVAEVIGTLCLRLSGGFVKPVPSVLTCVFYLAAIWLMALVLKRLEMGLTYAIWAAGGTALTVIAGVIWFNESVSLLKVIGLVLVISGVALLNLSAH